MGLWRARIASPVVAVMLLLPTLGVGQALASGGAYGWSSCTWTWKEAASNPNITFRDDGTFPPDVIRDGVLNSFQQRMSESVGKWNNAMNQIGLRGDLVRVTTGANITARYEGVAGADGITFIDGVNISQTGQCPVHGTVGDSIFSAQIYVAPRSDFFTQGSDRRALWEACPTQGGPAYTCSKQYDFGSVMIHELGHAIGFLHHPETVQMHDGSSGAVNLAKCANPLDQATMCAVLDDHRTHFRTLDAWDVESLRQVHLHF